MIALGLAALSALALQSPTPRAVCRASPTSDSAVVERLRACIDMLETGEFAGIWIDAFEGSTFTEGALTLSDVTAAHSDVWLVVDKPLKMTTVLRAAGVPPARTDIYQPHAYRVRFVGARAPTRAEQGRFGFFGRYGHMGTFSNLVVVDHFDSIVDLGVID